jgi:serine/threonine protein kinase
MRNADMLAVYHPGLICSSRVFNTFEFLDPTGLIVLIYWGSSDKLNRIPNMPVIVGDKLGPYEILGRIGAGGMGEVWKARDTRVDREVAIKVSTEQFSDRFEREARAIAALNHPNICTLFDVGPDYLVMELIEGPTLADCIKEGPLPFDEALAIARQIADALEAAHEKNIVHRDLKPANIKVRPDGSVKVLDFGLAKTGTPETTVTHDSPTLLHSPTQVGVILGTAAYMAPEQARGKAVDKRADIWSFATVFFEMLTGRRLFEGEDLTETLASVVKSDPDLTAVPRKVRRLLAKCLQKDPKKRLRDIGDAWELLEEGGDSFTANQQRSAFGKWGSFALGAAAIFAIAFAVLGLAYFHGRNETPASAIRFQIPAAPEISGIALPSVAPDGKKVFYSDGRRLWVRSFDSLEPRMLSNTEGISVGEPFWSADSQAIYFTAGGKLRRADLQGGAAQDICALTGLLTGGFTTADGRIMFFANPGGLFEVLAGGRTPSPLAATAEFTAGGGVGVDLGSVQILPDGNHFIFSGRRASANLGVYVASLDGQEKPMKILPYQSWVSWVPAGTNGSGYLLFIRDAVLMAQSFHANRLKFEGNPIPLVRGVNYFSASAGGALIYRTGERARRLKWLDRQGKDLGTVGSPGSYGELALSRDGTRAAVVRLDPVRTEIHQFATEATIQLTKTTSSVKPVWSPDGARIAFAGSTGDRIAFDLYEAPSSADTDPRPLLRTDVPKFPWDWSLDGRWLIYSAASPVTKEDLYVLPMQGEHKPQPFLVTDYTETDAAFSPDGRLVAYVSDESGKFELYVRSFPATEGGKWTVSSAGGYQPRWRHDGRELFYFEGDGRLMSVDVTPGATFKSGTPKFLFQVPIFGGGATTGNHYWDVAPDGQRFLINTVDSETTSTVINVVLNWQAELKK